MLGHSELSKTVGGLFTKGWKIMSFLALTLISYADGGIKFNRNFFSLRTDLVLF